LNVFVVGLDEISRAKLEAIENADRYRFHELLSLQEIQSAKTYPVGEWLARAERQLDAFTGSVDAIIGFWDFPVSFMVPILCEQYGTMGPALDVVLKCEHKYWARLLQRQVTPEAVPQFQAVDPFEPRSVEAIELDYPYWLKPVKAFASQLGFKVGSDEELEHALNRLREGVERFAEPFNLVLSRASLTKEVPPVDGHWCVAEELLAGTQHTVSGYAHRGDVKIYGVIDSLNYPGSTSFFRYRYPSLLPERVQDHAAELTRRIMREVGFDEWPFNVEFFYDAEGDRLSVLEINTRISQSHSDLFHKVDGASNHQVLVELATGQDPRPPHRQGDFQSASKLHFRTFEDGVVKRVPSEEDIARLEQEIPGALAVVQVEEGDRLSELAVQDAYSYRLGVIYIGGESDEQVMERWERARELLPFEVG
jgi:hypothetical protein